jgi:hypothetical protein
VTIFDVYAKFAKLTPKQTKFIYTTVMARKFSTESLKDIGYELKVTAIS